MSRTTRAQRPTGFVVGIVVTMLLAMTGCSTPGDAGDAVESFLPPAEGIIEYPLSLETAWGTITIESRPERVTIGTVDDLGIVASLGVTPVAAPESVTMMPWALDLLAEPIPELYAQGDQEYEPEMLAATDPDLLVATIWGEAPENYDQLGAVAPVLGAPDNGVLEPAWQDRLLLLGQALDLSERAQQIIDDHEDFAAGVRADHPEFEGKTAAMIGVYPDGDVMFLSGKGPINDLFIEWGFAPNPDYEHYVNDLAIAPENLGTIGADVIVVVDIADPADDLHALVADPLFQRNTAVQEGRLITIEVPNDSVVIDGEQSGFEGQFSWLLTMGGPEDFRVATELLTPRLSQVLR